MGASWRPGTAARLLALATALLLTALLPAPTAVAGTAADPELTDPAGDQEVDEGTVPVVPGVNDEPFDDVDLVAAWLEERGHDCVGEPAATCPAATLVVQTTAAWTTGTMTVGFTVQRGPASLPGSTATVEGTAFALTVSGTTVTGLANATAATAADGLRITLPLSALGASGGDLLANLTLATTRTDPGLLQDVDADDQTGTDEAGPGRAYTFARPAVNPRLLLDVVSVDGRAGSAATVREADAEVPIRLRVTNLGLDDDAYLVTWRGDPPLADPPAFIQAFTPIGAGESADVEATVSLAGMGEGLVTVTFSAVSERGATASATARLTIDLPAAPPPPPGEREVKPAGLTFLTGAAEGVGFDGPFRSYAELALLALLVLLAIVTLFLLLALGPATTQGEPAAEAPWPAAAGVSATASSAATPGPTGVMETVHASEAAPPALFASDDEETGGRLDADAAALAAAFADTLPSPAPVKEADAALPLASRASSPRIRIEEVRHTPREPEPGQQVTTEVLLRNDGGTASLRIALSVDGKPAAERTVQVAAHATKAVELPWTAGPGDNRVKIQAFPN